MLLLIIFFITYITIILKLPYVGSVDYYIALLPCEK